MELQFDGDKQLKLSNYLFHLDANKPRSRQSKGNSFHLMKTRDLITSHAARLTALRPHVIVEFGVQQGGSIVLFNELAKPRLHIGIDLGRDILPALEDFRSQAQQQGRSIVIAQGIDQSDRKSVERVIRSALNDHGIEALDAIIDDASHLYGPSLATFETTFPMLRAGGYYVLEDWGWAHWPAYQTADSAYANE